MKAIESTADDISCWFNWLIRDQSGRLKSKPAAAADSGDNASFACPEAQALLSWVMFASVYRCKGSFSC
jgi:hypothetical protein